jgi:type VI secretion system Hcp family effector
VALSKAVDSASPALALACAQHTNLGTVRIEICPATGGTCSYKIQLDTTTASAVQQSGAACIAPGACGPSEAESFSLSFQQIRWTYTSPSGTVKTSCWNLGGKAC